MLEGTGNKQADWRTDTAKSGIAGCIGDIGSPAENVAATITGLTIETPCADRTTFVTSRKFDDDGKLLLRYRNGVRAHDRQFRPLEGDFPTLADGARGVRFIEKAVELAHPSAKWTAR